jgi:hypothetical protein
MNGLINQAENHLSKHHFNFAHFTGPILTLRGPTSLKLSIIFNDHMPVPARTSHYSE